jgi:lactate dehydrogenase-like 2-hydroxyacid dehydrogenase
MHDLEILRQLTPTGLDVTVVERRGDDFLEVLRDTQYLVGYADKDMDDAFYENASSLKLIQLISAGYDKANIEAARRAGVAICNNGGANSGPVAEHAVILCWHWRGSCCGSMRRLRRRAGRLWMSVR